MRPRSRLRKSSALARAITLPDQRWQRCDIKCTNLLANVLGRAETRRLGAYDAILCDVQGYVTEATAMCVFGVEDGVLHTTPLGAEIMAGITQGCLIEIARDSSVAVHEELISWE